MLVSEGGTINILSPKWPEPAVRVSWSVWLLGNKACRQATRPWPQDNVCKVKSRHPGLKRMRFASILPSCFGTCLLHKALVLLCESLLVTSPVLWAEYEHGVGFYNRFGFAWWPTPFPEPPCPQHLHEILSRYRAIVFICKKDKQISLSFKLKGMF